MLAAITAATTFGAALLIFAVAEALFASPCGADVPVPATVSVLSGLAAGLLLASTLALICLLVLLSRQPSSRAAVVPLTTVAVVVSALLMLGVGYETVRPASNAGGYHSCR
ncbi:hypothetical protein [Nocardia neocaledoniensis]|uniref:hypothetical protein n=1 Tax=Nocardia neocaledoniensis TaxID=236511 RepID=UPI002456D1F5|nr:hypothetical protein [Nocardia neocaledoniensis]